MESKQNIAIKQNWLIYRLKGMNSVLTPSNRSHLRRMLPESYQYLITDAASAVSNLVEAIENKKEDI